MRPRHAAARRAAARPPRRRTEAPPCAAEAARWSNTYHDAPTPRCARTSDETSPACASPPRSRSLPPGARRSGIPSAPRCARGSNTLRPRPRRSSPSARASSLVPQRSRASSLVPPRASTFLTRHPLVLVVKATPQRHDHARGFNKLRQHPRRSQATPLRRSSPVLTGARRSSPALSRTFKTPFRNNLRTLRPRLFHILQINGSKDFVLA